MNSESRWPEPSDCCSPSGLKVPASTAATRRPSTVFACFFESGSTVCPDHLARLTYALRYLPHHGQVHFVRSPVRFEQPSLCCLTRPFVPLRGCLGIAPPMNAREPYPRPTHQP